MPPVTPNKPSDESFAVDMPPSAQGRLFQLSLDLLCVAGLDGYLKQVNPSWERVLGWTEAELLSHPVAFFMHPDDRDCTLAARAELARGQPVRGLENRYLCKDGSYRWLSWQCTIEPADGTVFGVARDITARRQSDHENLVLSKLESTGILAAGIAHDFNNLLTGLQLNLDMLELIGVLNEKQAQHLHQAQAGMKAARGLTQQLVSFASGGTSTERTATPLHGLLREAFEVALSGGNIRGECRIDADLFSANVNAAEITQVIRNLVLNAREAMSDGGTLVLQADNVKLGGELGPEYPAGDYIRISLTDQGGGISSEYLPKVFDPYFSTKQRGLQKGMGLGLTICHAVLQKHGGAISIFPSVDSAGTTVVCYLPAIVAPAGASAAGERLKSSASGRILVMDDEPAVLEIMSQTLTELGYEVGLAKDGQAAIDQYRQAASGGVPFDLMLLDLTVRGGLGGVEVVETLKAGANDILVPTILMTGYGSEKAVAEPRRHGFQAVLGKPFNLESLRTLLGDLMPQVGRS